MVIESKCYKITKENLIFHEIVGLRVKVKKSTEKNREGISGIVIEETKNTLIINSLKGKKIIPKKESEFEFYLGEEKVIINGKKILKKSEERTKNYKLKK